LKVEESVTLAGDGNPLKKYSVFTNLPKSQFCRPASADIAALCAPEETLVEV